MNHAQLFIVSVSGPICWEVRHDVTFELAGLIRRTPRGFSLTDENASPVGVFGSIASALEGLYELA